MRRKLFQLLLGQEGPTKGERVPSLAPTEALILKLLTQHGGVMYGLQMVDASDGRLKRGTVYVTLNRMEEKGLISSKEEEPLPGAVGLPRRLYKPTVPGVRSLEAWERVAQMFEERHWVPD